MNMNADGLLLPHHTDHDLTEEQEREAIAIAEAARRAEERAEQRALEKAMAKKRLERESNANNRQGTNKKMTVNDNAASNNTNTGDSKVVFVSRKRRQEMAEERAKEEEEQKRQKIVKAKAALKQSSRQKSSSSSSRSSSSSSHHRRDHSSSNNGHGNGNGNSSRPNSNSSSSHLTSAQLAAVKRSYLGSSAEETARQQSEMEKRKRLSKKITFKFEWDNSEDTSRDDDPLFDYSNKQRVQQGLLLKSKSKNNTRNLENGNMNMVNNKRRNNQYDPVATVHSVSTKPISAMTTRDWRIFRENYDIVVRGGRAPPPLRSFRESPDEKVPDIHPLLLEAIRCTLKYTTPSPIQRQAIPIGLQRRDLIGIAETGSGKTAAFGIPLCHHIFSLRRDIWDTVGDNGPLALIMAPTRELAIQIDVEIGRLLSHQPVIKTLAVIGGQEIQTQAYKLRQGIHIVVGTPGRINDCVEMSYLVLNQCSYIVLDEADRMIDLGFAPQIEQILDAMGGLLKDEDEKKAYLQEMEDLATLNTENTVPKHRLTAMFSATMPAEVERIAKKYLRHPAIVSIGDLGSGSGGKNARIIQRVLFLNSPKQKVAALSDILKNTRSDEKVIVFVNERKHADGVGRMVENAGKRCVILHGGKAQDQREENLETFRRGEVVLVATDVAGRGLDIPNVGHVINFDMPQRSIDNYSHRIGRTGRAGKEGLATSFITEEDSSIMQALVQYLENTDQRVPDRLKRHPSVTVGGSSQNIRI